MWRAVGHVAPVIAVDAGNIRYFVSTSDAEIARKIFVYGTFERDVLERAESVLGRFGGRYGIPGNTFVDIGANIGSATLLATVSLGARAAIAFEPEPSNFRLLRLNVLANGLEDRVRTVNCALSDRRGDAWLELSGRNSGNHYLRAEQPATPAVMVRTRSFDDFVLDGTVVLDQVGLVWMDVEGAEPRVLRGARSLLTADVPLVMEYWPGALQAAERSELLATLCDAYTTYVDLRDPAAGPAPIARLPGLHERFGNGQILTDILLIKA